MKSPTYRTEQPNSPYPDRKNTGTWTEPEPYQTPTEVGTVRLTREEIAAIADEVVRRLMVVPGLTVAPQEPIRPSMSVELEIAQVRQAGIDPVKYLRERARRARNFKRS